MCSRNLIVLVACLLSTVVVDADQYIGCFKDNGDRDLDTSAGRVSSVSECNSACKEYAFFGLQAYDGRSAQCWCGNEYGSSAAYSQVDNSECAQGVSLDGARSGGSWRNAVYSVTNLYVRAAVGVTQCPSGYGYVTTKEECNAARTELGISGWNDESLGAHSHRGPYCWIGRSNNANFHAGGDWGDEFSGSSLICKISAGYSWSLLSTTLGCEPEGIVVDGHNRNNLQNCKDACERNPDCYAFNLMNGYYCQQLQHCENGATKSPNGWFPTQNPTDIIQAWIWSDKALVSFNFQLRGEKGNEIVTITDGQEKRTRALSTSWETFSASNANIVIRFTNDQGSNDVFFRSNTPAEIRSDAKFAGWDCDTVDYQRCEAVRNGEFYWTADYQIEFKNAAYWKSCRWQSTRDQQLLDTRELMGWTCADNEILTGFGINADADIFEIGCCELGGHSYVMPDTCTFVGVGDQEFHTERASCNFQSNDHMVFVGAYDRAIDGDDDYTELLEGKCCEVKCDASWCKGKDWGVNTDQCQTISADPTQGFQYLVCPEGSVVTKVHDAKTGKFAGIQKVGSFECCELDVIAKPTQAPSTSPTTSEPSPSPTTAPSPSPTDAPSLSPTKAPSPSPTTAPSPSPTTAPSKAPTSTSDCLLALFQCNPALSDAEILQGIDDCLPQCKVPTDYYVRRVLEKRLLENAQ